MKIAIIGTGNLGSAIARGLINNNVCKTLYLTRRLLSSLKEFEDYNNVYLTTDNSLAIRNSDVLIFAVQPAQMKTILRDVASIFRKNHIVISTITGFSISRIEALIGSENHIIRAMPNTAIAVGKSMTCICSNKVGRLKLNVAEAIFNSLGATICIPESKIQAATIVCASGIAFWMRLIRATTQAAVQLGFDASEAQFLAMYTSEGASQLLIQNGKHPEQEIDKVTTPMGCTIEGLNEMEHKGLSSSLIHGMVASFKKINVMRNDQL